MSPSFFFAFLLAARCIAVGASEAAKCDPASDASCVNPGQDYDSMLQLQKGVDEATPLPANSANCQHDVVLRSDRRKFLGRGLSVQTCQAACSDGDYGYFTYWPARGGCRCYGGYRVDVVSTNGRFSVISGSVNCFDPTSSPPSPPPSPPSPPSPRDGCPAGGCNGCFWQEQCRVHGSAEKCGVIGGTWCKDELLLSRTEEDVVDEDTATEVEAEDVDEATQNGACWERYIMHSAYAKWLGRIQGGYEKCQQACRSLISKKYNGFSYWPGTGGCRCGGGNLWYRENINRFRVISGSVTCVASSGFLSRTEEDVVDEDTATEVEAEDSHAHPDSARPEDGAPDEELDDR